MLAASRGYLAFRALLSTVLTASLLAFGDDRPSAPTVPVQAVHAVASAGEIPWGEPKRAKTSLASLRLRKVVDGSRGAAEDGKPQMLNNSLCLIFALGSAGFVPSAVLGDVCSYKLMQRCKEH